MAIFGCIEGRYEVQDVPFGKVYGWRPERVVVECGCGETPTLTRSESACLWCEADHAPAVREGLAGLGRPPKDGSAHLWRQEAATGDRERDAGMSYCC